ncbi:transcription-repair coupling factor [Wansuia hejianensis]|uniref:Transcription-repair-coupling factor n=1 Tax=Wansuia hejianensis TaxID=2763667 RepID=A0A926F3I2_9FIRM|nr:transcription-repair coupling factor [Wansuia hejianensis]MBC8591234.1 transcription-repair coupling factor [Wansuia hejianensis]
MNNFLVDPLKTLDPYNKILADIKKGISPIGTYGIIDENLGHIAYGLNKHLNKQILLITYDELKARRLYEDIRNLGNEDVELFPKKEILFYDMDAYSYENLTQRLNVISKLVQGENIIVISSLEALLDKLIPRDIFKGYIRKVEFGKDIDLKSLLNDFVTLGYERVHMVEGIGQFSIRGGIIDFFPPGSQNPYRIELFDEEVDSIRTFDILSQRSLEVVEQVMILPVKEILIMDEFRKIIIKKLKEDLEEHNSNNRAVEKFSRYIEGLEENSYMENRDMLIPYIPDEFIASIVDYIDENALIFIDESKRLKEKYNSLKEDYYYRYIDLLQAGEVMPSHIDIRYKYEDIIPVIETKKVITKSSLLKTDTSFSPQSICNFSVKPMTNYHGKMDMLSEDIKHYMYRGYKIIILSGTEERGLRLQKSLEDFQIYSTFSKDRNIEIKSNQLFITPGSIEAGFEYSTLKLILISDKEIFGAQKKKTAKKKKKNNQTLSIADLDIGSYVVHENHGIGRYEGIEQLDIQGIKKDYLTIRYKDQDKLYIPIDQMNLIQKYIGSDSIKPKVSKLNSGEWQRTKTRAKKAVEDMAEDLLELYAKRQSLKGYAFSKDTIWQRQFEDLFPYEETEGQIKSIIEIKKDMEKPKPMDRLLCGDVGYGKTEVALRAAFKSLMDGKQVAILVPTTILAQQHYNTIIERFAEFPIKAALLSRFVTPKNQKLAIEGLNEGTVDIVVGTHRLLSKDVKFKDLGLLIIDEEQRFGVKHKESLKKLRESIDVLTLTATPIPRTLHMSLVGIRDMSVIEDPPEERYPIQTYIVEYNEQMIRDAVLKEVARGGQVYFVYNRVDTIDKMTSRLRKLIPEVSFAIAHGQMGERQLENVMMEFLNQEKDVLVCTTIIETGLDVPNVNTIIVYNADKMGLSQLYQLRGRVGRSNRIAYGYFVYEKNRVLTEVAEKRLRAIKEFTEFGSGFKIAMRDLEIRGAGNLLGMEQHGHIEAIGYDLYVKFLGEAIRRLKGEEVIEEVDTTIDINVDGYIPFKYIGDEEIKIQIYKKIAAINNIEDYRELLDELIDRFGDIPLEVQNLMDISYIKALSSKVWIKSITQTNKGIRLDLVSAENLPLELIHYLSGEYGRSISFDVSANPYLNYNPKGNGLSKLKELVEKISSFYNKDNNI